MAASLAPSRKSKRPRKVHGKVIGPLLHTSTAHTSPLLCLPPEIRHMIYTLALTTSTGTLIYTRSANGLSTPPSNSSARDPRCCRPLSLTSTCHQIALETQHLALALNTIVCATPKDALAFLRALSRKESAQGWPFRLKGIKVSEGWSPKHLQDTEVLVDDVKGAWRIGRTRQADI